MRTSSAPFSSNTALDVLGDPAKDLDIVPAVVENYWGAAFHWIAFACQQKHGQHKENHTQLAKYLRDLGEPTLLIRGTASNRRARARCTPI